MRSYSVRLSGARAASGDAADEGGGPLPLTEISVARFAELLLALQTLLYRVTREVADRADLGRTSRALERTSLARVVWSGDPRVVELRIGDPSTLEIDPFADAVDVAMGQILTGMGAGRRPDLATNPIAAAVDDLIRVLRCVADEVQVELPGEPSVALRPRELSRQPWQPVRTEPAVPAIVRGDLEMVDLHSGRFRIRDHGGETYDLPEVVDPETAARLVGQPVIVRGILLPGTGTQHNRVERARVAADEGLGGQPTRRRAEAPAAGAAPANPRAGPRAEPRAEPLNLSDAAWRRFLAAHRDDL